MAEDLNVPNPIDISPTENSEALDQSISSMNSPNSVDLFNETNSIENLPGVVNFENSYPDMSQFDAETFSQAVTFATEGLPNLENNQPYRDMIDNAAYSLNFTVPIANNDLNSPFPGRAANDFDPFKLSSGLPDNNTLNGRKATFAALQSETAKMFPNKSPGYKDPYYYGLKKYNMDRYYRHPKFQDLGFHPFADNESYYQSNSSKWDNFSRTRAAFTDMFGPAFTSGWRSISDMFTGDTLQADLVGAQSMEDAMRVGSSTSGGARGFFNDLFLNSAYTMGIITSIAAEEVALFAAAGAQGFLNPAADAALLARTAQNVGRVGKTIGKLLDVKQYGTYAVNAMNQLKSITNAKKFWAGARGSASVFGQGMGRIFTPESLYAFNKLKTSAKVGDNLTQMAKASTMFGGFYRDFRNVNMAWSESKMEGGLVELNLRDELYSEIKAAKDGGDPTEAELEMLTSDARAAGLTTTLINAPIIWLSNKLVLDGAMRGFRPIGELMDVSRAATRRYMTNPKSIKQYFYDAGDKWIFGDNVRKMWNAGAKGSLKHLAGTGLRYSSMNFAEGFQELFQEATSVAVKTYYKGLYEQPLASDMEMQLAEMVDAYESGMKSKYGDYDYTTRGRSETIMASVKAGLSSQMSGQGLHTFMSGFLMGGMIQGPQTLMFQTTPNLFMRGKDKFMGTDNYAKHVKAKEDRIKRTLEVLNVVHQDPFIFERRRVNTLLQKELNSEMLKASYENDITSFIDAKDASEFSHLYTVIESGMLYEFRNQMKSFQKLDDVDLKAAFPSVSSTPQKLRSRVDGMLKNMDTIEKSYKVINDEHVNYFDENKYSKAKEPRKHYQEKLRRYAFDQAKFMMMFSKDTFEKSLERANSIYNGLASDAALSNLAANDIAALTSIESLTFEISTLELEVQQKAITAKEKKTKKNNISKLALLKDYFSIMTAKENQATTDGMMYYDVVQVGDEKVKSESRNIGRFNKNKINALRPAFIKYVEFLNESESDIVLTKKQLNEALKKIVDWNYLKGRATDYSKAFRVLSDPEHMVEIADRLSVIMKDVWEEHKKVGNISARIRRNLDLKEEIAYLDALATPHDIVPDGDQSVRFLEDGTMPTEYYDKENIITQTSDPLKWQIIQEMQRDFRTLRASNKASTEAVDVSTTEVVDNALDIPGSTIEPDFDSMTSGMEDQSTFTKYQDFVKEDEETQKILTDAHALYTYDWGINGIDAYMEIGEWSRNSKGGQGIVRSRYELFQAYSQLPLTERTEKSFEEWILANQKNPLFVGSNGILSKHNVTMSDIAPSLAKEAGLKTDKLDKTNETIVATNSDIGITVIKKANATIDPKTGEFRTIYKLVDNNNKDISDKYSALDPTSTVLFPVYTTEAKALNALKFLKKNLPKKSTFDFAGEKFTTGDIVEDTNGMKWMVRSSKGMVVKNKNLYLVPTDKKSARKGSDDRKYLTADQWQKQGWNKLVKSEIIDLGSNFVTKITDYEPIKVFGFDQSKVVKGSKLYKEGVISDAINSQTQWQEFLRNLTEKQRNELAFLVEKNPEYNVVQEEIKQKKFRKYRQNIFKGKKLKSNPGLASGANEFNVTIMSGNKAVGILMGSGVTILRDVDGSIIDGLAITQTQAERLFITQGDPNAAARIRRRYKIADNINTHIREAIGNNSFIKMSISELPGIKLENSAGSLPYTKNKDATPWDELLHNNIDGELWIYDIRTTWENDERSVKFSRLTNELDLLALDESITATERLKLRAKTEQIDKQVSLALSKYLVNGNPATDIRETGLGRYVQVIKLPNGTVTFVELIANDLSIEQIDDITQTIRNQQVETLNKNFKDGKVINADFNTDFNNNLEDSFYFSMKPGENLSIGVSQYGDISVRYINKDEQLKESITLNLESMLDIENGKSFIDKINKEWSSSKKTTVKLDLKNENFVENIPNRAVATDLTAVTKVKMRPEIRSNILANIESVNAIEMQASENVSVNMAKSTGGTMTQTTPYGTESGPSVDVPLYDNLADDVTQEDFNKLMDNNFENIDENTLEIIRVKLRAGVTLKPLEEEIKNAYEILNKKDLIDQSEVKTEEVDPYIRVANEIKTKKSQRESKIKEFRKNELARLKTENPDASLGSLRVQVTRNLKDNEEINQLGEEISKAEKNLNSQSPFKIVDSFDNHFIEDIDKFIVFVKANLPDFMQVEDIDALASRLKNNGITAGAFVMELGKLTNGMDITGKIYTGKQNPFKYHEAFHGVFRMLLSEEEIQKYLKLAKTEKLAALRKENKTLDQALKELKTLSPTYSRMTRKELEETLYEEYLADEFEKFKINPRSTGIAAAIKNFFTKVINILKSVFTTYSKNDIELLFSQINNGKYRLSGLASNRFTEKASVGVSNVAWSIKKGSQTDTRGDGSQIILNKYFTVPEEKAIVATVGGSYLEKLKNTNGEYNPKDLLDESIVEFIELWNPERGVDARNEGGFFTEQSNYDDFIDGLIERYEALTFAYLNNDIGKATEDYLGLFDETIQDKILERVDIDEFGQVKTTDQYDASANEIGGWQSLSTGVRKFLGTTTIITKDRFGVQYSEPVNINNGYQGLLKTMSGTTDVNTMISKMQQFAATSVHSKAIIERLFNEVGLEKLNKDNLVSTDYNLENDVTNSLLFQSIIKSFTQFKIDYTFIETDQKTGVVNLYAANHKDDASIQSDQWSAAYGTKFIGLSRDPGLRRSASNTVKDLKTIFQKTTISDSVLFRELTYISNELFDKVGISLSVGYLKYSVLNNMDVTNLTAEQLLYRQSWREAESNAMTLDDAAQLEDQINDHGISKDGAFKVNLFANIDDTVITDETTKDSNVIGEVGSIKGRIKRMARGNAIFDERVGNSVFRDPEGNLIYAHQMPTFNLEKVAELNSEDAIAALKGDDMFLESNMLLNDPKFIQLARNGKLRIQRVIGSKQVELIVDEITGERKSKNTLDLNNKRATKFGSSTPTEFLAALMNTYLFEYDASTGEYRGNTYDAELDSGDIVKDTKFASALISLRVMAEASTNDFIALPIFKSVEKVDGNDKITADYIEKTLGEVENEYNRAKREYNSEDGSTKDEVLGYNFPDKDGRTRAYELFKTGNLLTRYTKPLINKTEIKFKTLKRDNNVNEDVAITKGNVRLLLGSSTRFNKTGLDKGKSALVNIKDEQFLLYNRGLQTIEEFGFENIKEKLGSDITIGSKGGNKYKTKSINSQEYFVATAGQRDFINGKKALNIFELEKITSESMVFEEDGSVAIYDTNASVKIKFEEKIKEGVDFETAIKDIEEDNNISVKDLIEESLEREFKEFQFILTESGANKLIDTQLSTELKTVTGKTQPAKDSMIAYNLRPNDMEFNYKQVFLNDYLLTRSMNQVLLGDAATRYKNTVDEIKRAKMQNASGPSAQSVIASKKHNILHPVKHISLITFNDPKFITKYSKKTTGDKADAQMWMTTKAFKYMMFGFGRLSDAQNKILNKIKAGDKITADEYYGSVENKTKGFKSQDGTINSKKLVYADGKTFLKMSAFTLTKRYTSDPKTNFETALPGREKEHNLRLKLERVELDGNETLGIAVPVTASKMFKSNIISENEVFGEKGKEFSSYTDPKNITSLDARWMRLQQINPSGKIEVVDPTQIKQLITSEQSDDVEVSMGGKTMTIGDVRKLYNTTVGHRVSSNFLIKRNLVFTYKNALDALEKSVSIDSMTPDLEAFLRYAIKGLESSQARGQFLELFETDKNGAQKYNLNNPITERKFGELFLSYFSKNVFREYQPGHSVTLKSDMNRVIKKVTRLDENGQPIEWDVIRMDDYIDLTNRPDIKDLEYADPKKKTFANNALSVGDVYLDDLRYNIMEYKNGVATGERYSEFMLPPHFSEIMKNLKPGQTIPDVIAKAFATRIPSQDKHSAINLKLVDFLPVEYGSTGIFPEELIEVSGADFDIDKVTMQIKEFYVENGEFVEYGKSNDVNVQYKEYIDYQIKEAGKGGSSMNDAVGLWDSRGRETYEGLEEDITTPSDKIIGALTILGLPRTSEEFVAYKEKYKEKIGDDVVYKYPYQAAQNNVILDARYALLGNEGVSGPLFGRPQGIAQEPATLNALEDVWTFIQNELPELANETREEGVDIDNLNGKFKSFKSNVEGGRSIGAVVKPNIALNFLKENKISLRQKNINGNLPQIFIDNKYDTFDINYQKNIDGSPVDKSIAVRNQDVISSEITAATDNAKERLLAKLGLNKDALAVTANLVALGMPIKTAILLVNQPEIRDAYHKVDVEENVFLKSEIKNTISSLVFQYGKEVQENSFAINVTTSDLINQIKNKDQADKSKNDITNKIAILNQFLNAYALKQATSKLGSVMDLTSGLGRDSESLDRKQNDIDELGIESNNSEFNKLDIPIDVRKVFKQSDSFIKVYYDKFKEFNNFLPKILISRTEGFKKMTSLVINNLDLNPSIATAVKSETERNILSYLTGKAYIQHLKNSNQVRKLDSLQNGMIYDKYSDGQITVSDTIINIKNHLVSENKDNYFMDLFLFNTTTKNPTNNSGINEARMNTWTSLNDSQVIDMQTSLLELLSDPFTNREVKDLVHYLLVKDGLQYAPNSFLPVIPAPLLDEILAPLDRVQSTLSSNESSDQNYKNTFGLTLNELGEDLITGYLQSRKMAYYLPSMRYRFFRTKPTIVTESKKDIDYSGGKASVIEDVKEGTLTIDKYALARVQQASLKKGKGRKVEKSGYKKGKTIALNMAFIKSRGGKIVDVPVNTRKFKGTVELLKFDNVIYYVTGTTNKKYHFFQLQEVFSPSYGSETESLYDLNKDGSNPVGTKAIYKRIKMLGSMSQNPTGFVYDTATIKRTAYDELPSQLEANNFADQDATLNFDEITKDINEGNKVNLKDRIGADITIDANENSMTIINNSNNKEINLQMLENMSNNNDPDFSTINIDNANTVIMPKGFNKFDAMSEDASVPGEYKAILDFYNSLDGIEKSNIFREIGIEDTSDLIKSLEISEFTEEEYIEQLKKCYK